MKDVARNKKAFFDYEIEEKLEAGVVLLGTEVKSLREGNANLKEAYVAIREGEAWLLNCHISPYRHGNVMNHEPTRQRKLLLHRREIERLGARVQQKGYTLLPLRLYFSRGHVKLEVGLGRGKRFFEKRESIKEREDKIEMDRALKSRNR